MDAQQPTREEILLQPGLTPLRYQIKRSPRRRTVTLAIDAATGLTVHCPQRFSRAQLESLLREKQRWILEKCAKAEGLRSRLAAVRWAPGESLPYLGGHYPLEIQHKSGRVRGDAPLRLENERLRLLLDRQEEPSLPPDRVRELVIHGYKVAAQREIPARVAQIASALGVKPRRVAVREQKRRWGSCSARGSLNFNWRLILAPAEVMEYVVVHELCHLLVLDHSPRFWAHVAALLPDYRILRAWLREQGGTLFI
jgi:hypothetical protein